MHGNVLVRVPRGAGRSNAPGLPGLHRALAGSSGRPRAGRPAGIRTPARRFIVVTAGTPTVYDGDDAACTPDPLRARLWSPRCGPAHVHLARNESPGTPVTVVQIYRNVPPGGSQRIDEPAPGNCPF
jgi:hypothetical protein